MRSCYSLKPSRQSHRMGNAYFRGLTGVALIWLICAATCDREVPPSPAQIIQRHIEATGGLAAYQSVICYREVRQLHYHHDHVKANIVLEIKPSAALRYTNTNDTGWVVQAGYTEGTGWVKNGPADPELTTGRKLGWMQRQVKFVPTSHAGDLYESIEYAGRTEVNGKTCHRVEFTFRVGGTFAVLYEIETGLLTAIEEPTEDDPNSSSRTVYSDYRSVDGLKFPFKHRTEHIGGGETTVVEAEIEKIELNQPIDEKRLKLPENVSKIVP